MRGSLLQHHPQPAQRLHVCPPSPQLVPYPGKQAWDGQKPSDPRQSSGICEESPDPSSQGGHWVVNIPRPAPVRATAVPQFPRVKCGSGVGGRVNGGGQGPWRGQGGGALLLTGGHCRDSEQHLPRKARSEPSDRCSRGLRTVWSSCSKGLLGQL